MTKIMDPLAPVLGTGWERESNRFRHGKHLVPRGWEARMRTMSIVVLSRREEARAGKAGVRAGPVRLRSSFVSNPGLSD
jgi:hypothetical protein